MIDWFVSNLKSSPLSLNKKLLEVKVELRTGRNEFISKFTRNELLE